MTIVSNGPLLNYTSVYDIENAPLFINNLCRAVWRDVVLQYQHTVMFGYLSKTTKNLHRSLVQFHFAYEISLSVITIKFVPKLQVL
jgi:hypothetical protein